jgi:hypothetical protein
MSKVRLHQLVSQCMWFARCTREAIDTVKHPILGNVPICQHCKDKLERISNARP